MNSASAGDQRDQPVFVVALTGGIASGKTAVSDQFALLGVPVIDTDVIARELVQPGKPLLAEIARSFGKAILDEEGALKRRALREIIFSDPEKKQLLESILHPAIRAESWRRVAAADNAYCVLVIPLLVESGGYTDVDRILVVDVSRETQLERLTARDGVSDQQALGALDAQASRAERLEIADDVLDNSGTQSELANKVLELHRFYHFLSQQVRG